MNWRNTEWDPEHRRRTHSFFMINALLGIKKNMTSTYDARSRRVGATIVEIPTNFVTQVKNSETKDGYSAIQIGMGTKKSVKKPQLGSLKKAGIDQKVRWFKEVLTTQDEQQKDLKPGTEIKLNQVFSIGDAVKVTATSKGKGFAGTVKRHGFAGGPKTHGQSDRHRAPGSIGSGTTPGRVYRGKKMAGHMGNETVSTLGLEVVGIDKANNLITIKGAIPGATGGLVLLTHMGKIKGYTAPPEEKPDNEEEAEANNDVIPGSEATPESSQEDAGQASMTETKEGEENA